MTRPPRHHILTFHERAFLESARGQVLVLGARSPALLTRLLDDPEVARVVMVEHDPRLLSATPNTTLLRLHPTRYHPLHGWGSEPDSVEGELLKGTFDAVWFEEMDEEDTPEARERWRVFLKEDAIVAGRCDPPPAGARVYEVCVRERIEHTIYIEALDGEAATEAYDEASGHIEDVFHVTAHHVIGHGADVVGVHQPRTFEDHQKKKQRCRPSFIKKS